MSQGASKATPTSTRPTELSLILTTLTGHQRVSTGLTRPIQTCLLGGSSLVRISAPPELMSRNVAATEWKSSPAHQPMEASCGGIG